MKHSEFDKVIETIIEKDDRFDKGAYYFIRKALDFTVQELHDQGKKRENFHVTGKELLEGIRKYALDQCGPMTYTVFTDWKVNNCEDFGSIVFNLVETGIFGKTKDDNIHDFTDGYDFSEAFVKPFEPSNKSKTKAAAIKRPKKSSNTRASIKKKPKE